MHIYENNNVGSANQKLSQQNIITQYAKYSDRIKYNNFGKQHWGK